MKKKIKQVTTNSYRNIGYGFDYLSFFIIVIPITISTII